MFGLVFVKKHIDTYMCVLVSSFLCLNLGGWLCEQVWFVCLCVLV